MRNASLARSTIRSVRVRPVALRSVFPSQISFQLSFQLVSQVFPRVLACLIFLATAFLCAIFLLSPAAAQHGGGGGGGHGGGGGGGHSGGGHSSSGHSSGHSSSHSSAHSGGSHSGGHFGWLHFGRHPGHKEGSEAAADFGPSSYVPAGLWNLRTRRGSPGRMPTTLLWSPLPLRPRLERRGLFPTASVPLRQDRFFRHRFPRFGVSGCFFNGLTQVCFFEPFFSLFCGGLGYYDSGFGFEDGWTGWGDDAGLTQSDMAAMADAGSAANPADNDGAEENSTPAEPAAVPEEDRDLGAGVFVLVLHNGTTQRVTDYWTADGYLEYVSPDGTRSHVPLDALDLQGTVLRNAPRGLAFVLRSTPAR